ncbi:hypothetical protein EDD22DRAFT_967839 [Suillus occidentalis]|nr:hypothetical protein EDD22DRAFT_967839 [Suillus occidentalis]
MNATDLTELKIMITGHLRLKPNLNELVAATIFLGQNELWSSTNLYRQLLLLENLVPKSAEVAARAWIDAFFFRASAMLPSNKAMILNMEHVVSATTLSPSSMRTHGGFVDYTAIVADECDAHVFLTSPRLDYLRTLHMPSGFFVTVAGPHHLSNYIAQAVCEMYACGKYLQKKVIRGALTNGREWIFILIKVNDDYDGASRQQSSIVKFDTMSDSNGQLVIIGSWPDIIAAILLHWIQNSFVDLTSDDWFELVPRRE